MVVRRNGGVSFHLAVLGAALALRVGDGLSPSTEVSRILPLAWAAFAALEGIILAPVLCTIAHSILLLV
jgi:hypothetical protein